MPPSVRVRQRVRPTVRTRGQAHGDTGSASLFVLWVALLAWWLGIAAVIMVCAVVARHRAPAAADLAALAAADRALSGPAAACRAAQSLSADMGTQLGRCTVQGLVADVSVLVKPAVPLPGIPEVAVRARAGPAESPRPMP